MAFFLESTFVGCFFFGWDKLGKDSIAGDWLLFRTNCRIVDSGG